MFVCELIAIMLPFSDKYGAPESNPRIREPICCLFQCSWYAEHVKTYAFSLTASSFRVLVGVKRQSVHRSGCLKNRRVHAREKAKNVRVTSALPRSLFLCAGAAHI